MDPKLVIIIIVAAVVILGVLWMLSRKRRTALLKERFGPEYDRTLREHGTRGEALLAEREKRVEKFTIRELAADERERFISEWRAVQSRFVDAPNAAVGDADSLVSRLMQTRGYPMADFEQRAADLSVDHPRVVDNYRAAHEIAERHRLGQATTEDLRQAMIYYRSLFDDLLHTKSEGRREVA